MIIKVDMKCEGCGHERVFRFNYGNKLNEKDIAKTICTQCQRFMKGHDEIPMEDAKIPVSIRDLDRCDIKSVITEAVNTRMIIDIQNGIINIELTRDFIEACGFDMNGNPRHRIKET